MRPRVRGLVGVEVAHRGGKERTISAGRSLAPTMLAGPSRSLPDLVRYGTQGEDTPSTPPPVSRSPSPVPSPVPSSKGKLLESQSLDLPSPAVPLRSQSESPIRFRRHSEEVQVESPLGAALYGDTVHPTLTSDASSIHSAPDQDTSPSPPAPTRRKSTRVRERLQSIPFSLWDYLQEEVMAVETEHEEGLKTERVTNFLSVPGEVEKVRQLPHIQRPLTVQIILFGIVICLDSFLYTFTILPLRSLTALLHLVRNTFANLFNASSDRRHLRLSHKCDLVKVTILVATVVFLAKTTDASQMYHSVRGQETLKLYVIFNVLEVRHSSKLAWADESVDCGPAVLLVWARPTGFALLQADTGTADRRLAPAYPTPRTVWPKLGLRRRPHARALLPARDAERGDQLVLERALDAPALEPVCRDQGLRVQKVREGAALPDHLRRCVPLLIVHPNLATDIVERFQLAIMLFIIALRNLIELSSASSASLFSLLPASFSLTLAIPTLPTLLLLQTIFSPALIVLMSECAVDWLKHAFITKFNHIRPAVYSRFIDVLCKDLVGGRSRNQPFVDQSPIVSRRLGFASLPLGCLVVRVLFQAFEMLADDSHVDECAPGSARAGFVGSSGDLWSRATGWAVIGLMAVVIWAS